MLAGTLDWIPAPRTVTPPQPRHESPPPQEFTPAQHSHTYRKPPKPRAERRRVKLDSTEADSAHTGDARELIGTQVRRQPTTKSLHDPGLNRVASVLARPKAKKKNDFSDDPTRRLQAMLRQQS